MVALTDQRNFLPFGTDTRPGRSPVKVAKVDGVWIVTCSACCLLWTVPRCNVWAVVYSRAYSHAAFYHGPRHYPAADSVSGKRSRRQKGGRTW